MKKLFKIVGDVLVALIIISLSIITVAVICSRNNETKTPNLFGYAVMSVQTDSMAKPTGFYPGDIIFVKMLDKEEANNLNVGDVISFSKPVNGLLIVDTHRIVKVEKYNGISSYRTRGDNALGEDRNFASAKNILGTWTGKRISKVGKVFDFLHTQLGFFLCVVLPVAIFFMYELYEFIVVINYRKKEKAMAEVGRMEDAIKQKAIEEYLAQQKKEEETTNGNE